MRTIVHLSDLHFGRIHPPTVEPLIRAVRQIKPHLVAISGDLTQRAKVEQFKEARAFLDALPTPQIVVPGNHDVPLYNPVLRLSRPLDRFQRYITRELAPVHIDEEMAVLGVNTTRRLVKKGGRVNREQIAGVYERFCGFGDKKIKIVVTHHPFDLPRGFTEGDLVGRARMAMKHFASCGVDVFLAGHLHLSHAGDTARYEIDGYSALVIQAGTAISSRGRGELNSFNVLRATPSSITLEILTWQPECGNFAVSETRDFQRSPRGWIPR